MHNKILQAFNRYDVSDNIINVSESAFGNGQTIFLARENARREALEKAYSRITEIVWGVRVKGRTTVENAMVTEDIITTETEGTIDPSAVQILNTKYEDIRGGGSIAHINVIYTRPSNLDRVSVQSEKYMNEARSNPALTLDNIAGKYRVNIEKLPHTTQ